MKKATVDDKGQIYEEYDDWKEYRDRIISELNKCKSKDDINTWMIGTFISILSNITPEKRLPYLAHAYAKVMELEGTLL